MRGDYLLAQAHKSAEVLGRLGLEQLLKKLRNIGLIDLFLWWILVASPAFLVLGAPPPETPGSAGYAVVMAVSV